VTNESLTSQLRDHRQRLFDRILRWFRHIADSKIDHIEPVAAEIFQVVVHAVDQLLVGTGMKPRVVGPSTCADFRHDHEARGIAEGHAMSRRQRWSFAPRDNLIKHLGCGSSRARLAGSVSY
jgi:hypothetical protein